MNREVNNKVLSIDKTNWYTVKPSIIERVKETITFLFIMMVGLLWLIVLNA